MYTSKAWVRNSVAGSLGGAVALLLLTLTRAGAQDAAAVPAAGTVGEPVSATAQAVAPVPAVAVVPAAAVAAAPELKTEEAKSEQVEAVKSETVRRDAEKFEAEQLMAQGSQEFRKSNYVQAMDAYKKAEAKFQEISKSEPSVVSRLDTIKKWKAEVLADWAESLAHDGEKFADTGKYDAAVQKCNEAAEADPSMRQDMADQVRQYLDLKKKAEFRSLTAETNVDKGKVERDYNNTINIEEGKVMLRNHRYGDAREYFERVLIVDPYNTTAIRYLRQVNRELTDVGELRRQSTIAERVAEVRWKWNEPVSPALAGPAGMGNTMTVKKGPMESAGIRYKLESIIIPKVEFEEATIVQVVSFLKKRSQELDPEHEGVNIIFYTGASRADAAAPAPADGAAPAPADGAAPAPADVPVKAAVADWLNKPISLNLNNVPLGAVLRYVCMAANLKFRVENVAIMIADKNEALDEMETRFYPIEANVIETKGTTIKAGGGFARGGGGGGGNNNQNDAITVTDADSSADAAKLQDIFKQYGVEFPRGATITFNQRLSQLVVKNTPENLRKIEEVLKIINQATPQVTIEAKFVDIDLTEMNALGMRWTLNNTIGSNLPAAGATGNLVNGYTGMGVANDQGLGALNPTNLSNGIRGLGKGTLDSTTSPDILNVNAILGGASFSAVLSALQQSTSVDILSCPKVTTVSGQPAVIKKVTERYFPEDFQFPDLPSITTGGSSGGGTTIVDFGTIHMIPKWRSDPDEIGVILNVTPQVSADGYTITMDLEPIVREFTGWDTDFNSGEVPPIFNVQMPIFETRTVKTKVVVWDGETVVLGGFIGERDVSYKDQIPILGDIPILGRLFQMKGSRKEKTNLMIFVTPRMVTNSGTPMRNMDVRGLPDFRH